MVIGYEHSHLFEQSLRSQPGLLSSAPSQLFFNTSPQSSPRVEPESQTSSSSAASSMASPNVLN